jgi:hypothetical protein
MVGSASVGADVSLTDLYPDKYPSADPPAGSKFFHAKALERAAPFGGTAQGARSLIAVEAKNAGYRA